MRREKAKLAEAIEIRRKILMDWIKEHGPIQVEGLPALDIQEVRSGWSWDCKSMAEAEPAEFKRLLELGAITINTQVADALMKAGQISGMHRRFGIQGSQERLEFERQR